ncbi:transcription termination factor Rho [Pseudoscardovia radai]|nr:transcription termination factor Rho [Pseudoscardovia radai]
MADSQNLSTMTVAELREKAKDMGLKGFTALRKSDLVSLVASAQEQGDSQASAVSVATQAMAAQALDESPSYGSSAQGGMRKSLPLLDLPEPRNRTREDSAQTSEATRDDSAGEVRVPRFAGARRVTRDAGRPTHDDSKNAHTETRDRGASLQTGQLDLDLDLPRRRHRNAENRGENRRRVSAASELDNILASLPSRSGEQPVPGPQGGDQRRAQRGDRDTRDARQDRAMRDNRDRRGMRQGRMRDDRDERANRDNRMDRQGRQGRDRYADRSDRFDRQNRDDRRMRADERQDNLVAVAGIVDVLDSYAFIRTSGYLPGPNDVYVSMSQVRKYGLRKGDAVRGYTRANNNNDGGNNRNNRNAHQKFVPLQSLETINGMSVEEAAQRPQFSKLTPLYPQERLRMETTPNRLVGRMIDLCAPIGKGQRGLIVSPPKAGKTITLQQIANAITTNNPEVHLMVVLVDERPEEVTDMQRTVQGEIISSTFDRPASDHTIVAELAIERAKRLVELGQDVVVLLDSMTRLARAYNIAAPASGRILSGGVDAQALYPPKKFFGAARNIENGGSLTIIASALVETGSKMDEVIFEEFKGTGNMELRLSRELAEKRMFPAIDINASGTRREELITDPKELMIIYRLRRALGGMEVEQAYNAIVPRMKKTASNRDFLAALASGQNPAAVPSA